MATSPIYGLVVEGLDSLKDIEGLDERQLQAARRAINATLDRTRAAAARLIRSQVNLPASYVSPAQGRLAVVRRASAGSLEGTIRAQGRATSLARFATSRDPAVARRAGGVSVQVKPGAAQFMKRAFLVRLRSGSASTDSNGNLGLAIRLKPGETLKNKAIKARPLFNNVYLLYGPSVYQIIDNSAEDKLFPDAEAYLSDEYFRQLDL